MVSYVSGLSSITSRHQFVCNFLSKYKISTYKCSLSTAMGIFFTLQDLQVPGTFIKFNLDMNIHTSCNDALAI